VTTAGPVLLRRFVRPNGSGRVDLLEEVERDFVDDELTLPSELRCGIVERLGGGEGAQVPRVAVVVRVFGVTAGGYGVRGGNAGVDWVDGPEGVDVDFVAG